VSSARVADKKISFECIKNSGKYVKMMARCVYYGRVCAEEGAARCQANRESKRASFMELCDFFLFARQ
jgi:hypothetical protein